RATKASARASISALRSHEDTFPVILSKHVFGRKHAGFVPAPATQLRRLYRTAGRTGARRELRPPVLAVPHPRLLLPENQRRLNHDAAVRNGEHIASEFEFSDLDLSGRKNVYRPGFEKAIRTLLDGRMKTVYGAQQRPI